MNLKLQEGDYIFTRKLMMEEQLNEGFAVRIGVSGSKKQTLLFVSGFQVNENYAVVYNHKMRRYYVIYVGTGLSVGESYASFEETKKNYRKIIRESDKKIKSNKKWERTLKEAIHDMVELLSQYEVL